MKEQRYYYLITVQFLGFRYHGWQKQPSVKTVEEMIYKTITFVIGKGTRFKILGASRTDAKVSAQEAAFELFLYEPMEDTDAFITSFNRNTPSDIRAVNITEVDQQFNIIQAPKTKEYVYLFSHGEKNHPYAAPFMANIIDHLDIELMKEGAKLFEGRHYFKSYCGRANENKNFEREIIKCELVENKILEANFFPESSYALHVQGSGFMRYQVRLIMGVLILLGKGEVDLKFIKESLKEENDYLIEYVAPASGLHLNTLKFD
ncbi:tRNA pseudouridine(38-40) synthase TruA [Flavobacteriaceae bacterium R38]|nr:tRNA pseudouridine(38-40) synthase TruA [Flavobacteriaceae bacterium R38]